MISPLKTDKGKNQWHVPIKKILRSPSIKKTLEIIPCTLSFILIYLCLLEICKEFLMIEHTEQQYRIRTRLVGRHNTSSMLMFQCWVMVAVFHNILSFMIQLKKYIKCYHVHMWEAIQVKRVTNFSQIMDSCISKTSWNIYYGFNKWHANYKTLENFGKYYG